MKSRFVRARRLLVFWTLFVGVGAVAGALGMLLDPTGRAMGMDAMLPYFQKLPFADALFSNFTFSGIALLCVNGLPNLAAAWLLLRRKRAGVVCGGIFGVTLMLWICIQFYMFPLNFMSTAYFVFGLAQAATGYAAYVFAKQEAFAAQARAYPHLGETPARLVVYFSRMGYTERLALEEANRTGARVFRLRANERTEGTAGFWQCGRFGLCRWDMPLCEMPQNLSQYEHVTICSPIWVFASSAPVRAFCRAAKGQIREADYLLVHHTRGRYTNAANEMDALLGLRRTGLRSVCCQKGTYKSEWRESYSG